MWWWCWGHVFFQLATAAALHLLLWEKEQEKNAGLKQSERTEWQTKCFQGFHKESWKWTLCLCFLKLIYCNAMKTDSLFSFVFVISTIGPSFGWAATLQKFLQQWDTKTQHGPKIEQLFPTWSDRGRLQWSFSELRPFWCLRGKQFHESCVTDCRTTKTRGTPALQVNDLN